MASLNLNWDPPSDWGGEEGHFNIYHTTTSNPSFPGDYSQVHNTTNTQWTHTGIAEDTTHHYAATSENSAGESAPITGSATTYLEATRTVTSHSAPIASEVDEVLIDVTVLPSSHVGQVSSEATREVTSVREVESHSDEIHSSADRALASARKATSHAAPIRSWVHSNRTSLELLDYTVEWDDSESAWFTPWVQEVRILGGEDQLVLRGEVVDDAADPVAKVTVQYDETGDGQADENADPIYLDGTDNVHEVTGVPVTDDGFYRLKICEYGGYNSLHSLDMAIVH